MGTLPRGGSDDDLPTLWPPHALPRATERTKVAMALSSPAVDRRKQLGAFYTPPHLVSALVDWAVRDASDRILEPAAGEAAFLLAALKRLKLLGASDAGSRVVGVEIDAAAAAETRNLLAGEGPRSTVLQQDFFEVSPEKTGTFNVALGNPPYVRYHLFRGEARERGRVASAAAGVNLTGLASSWAPFVIHTARFLAPDGRLAFVLPAELLHVDYAGPVREFLLRRFGSVTVIVFDEAVFPGATIDTALLLAEGGPRRGLRVVRMPDSRGIREAMNVEAFSPAPAGRWSSLLSATEGPQILERLRRERRVRMISDVASVDIGFVSGANDFFVLTRDEARRSGLRRALLRPAIVRPGQLRGAILSASDASDLLESERCLLLSLSASGLDRATTDLGRYLRRGKRLGIHRGYKCRVRNPWYVVPGIRVPDAFMSYMSNITPRIVLNEAGFSSSNLVHQLTFHLTERNHARAYIAALHSSPALLSFELEGRSYGGGVLKHETKEAERVLFPFDDAIAEDLAMLLPAVDLALRDRGAEAAAALVDAALVAKGLLTNDDLAAIRQSRAQLHARRVGRGRTA